MRVCVLFFSYSCGNRRVLHSFPTRRSSDLGGAVPPAPPTAGAGSTARARGRGAAGVPVHAARRERGSEEHTSELQSRQYLVCRLLLEKKKPRGRHSSPVGRRGRGRPSTAGG